MINFKYINYYNKDIKISKKNQQKKIKTIQVIEYNKT